MPRIDLIWVDQLVILIELNKTWMIESWWTLLVLNDWSWPTFWWLLIIRKVSNGGIESISIRRMQHPESRVTATWWIEMCGSCKEMETDYFDSQLGSWPEWRRKLGAKQLAIGSFGLESNWNRRLARWARCWTLFSVWRTQSTANGTTLVSVPSSYSAG